jgi:hypothetical protein
VIQSWAKKERTAIVKLESSRERVSGVAVLLLTDEQGSGRRRGDDFAFRFLNPLVNIGYTFVGNLTILRFAFRQEFEIHFGRAGDLKFARR